MGWSYPSPVFVDGEYKTGGMVWTGNHACTQADIDELNRALVNEGEVHLDKGTLVGRWHRDYTTFSTIHDGSTPQGGLGSIAYETQKVNPDQGEYDVKFTSEPLWYYNEDGNRVHGIPPEEGAYHEQHTADGPMAFEGPKPGSYAEQYRGTGEFYWDEEHEWYDVRGRSTANPELTVCPHCGGPL